jgi:hypothetical protein
VFRTNLTKAPKPVNKRIKKATINEPNGPKFISGPIRYEFHIMAKDKSTKNIMQGVI